MIKIDMFSSNIQRTADFTPSWRPNQSAIVFFPVFSISAIQTKKQQQLHAQIALQCEPDSTDHRNKQR